MKRPIQISYFIFAGLLVAMGLLHLAAPFLTILFSYFLLGKLENLTHSKKMAIAVLVVLVALLSWASIHFARQMLIGMPELVAKTLPAMIDYLDDHGVNLPFDDLQGLKLMIVEHVQKEWGNFGKLAGTIARDAAFSLVGLVVAVSLFLNKEVDIDRHSHAIPNNWYLTVLDALADRFRSFFISFERVMGAQVTISVLNTGFTSVFITICALPYSTMLIGVTFLCGLFPIIGNLISNIIIVGVAFTVSPKMALAAAVFLVVIHKLEYFLNSKIIGERIKNPVWMTLLGLIVGERLLGIPGMILAPVVLNFIRVEASSRAVAGGDREDSRLSA